MDHAELLAKANVVAVGEGYKVSGGERVYEEGVPVMATVVSVTAKVSLLDLDLDEAIPPFDVENTRPTDVVEVGVIRIVTELDPKVRHRPVHAGLSLGLNPDVTAGTFGFVVVKPGSPKTYVLSNWHVIAASNVPVADRDNVAITQPGTFDGGRVPDDVVAELAEFVPIGGLLPDLSDCNIGNAVARSANALAYVFGARTRLQAIRPQAHTGEQLVDAAIGLLSEEASLETPFIGRPISSGVAALGMQVQKYGRTTEYTMGEVTQVGMSVIVQGYPNGPVQFTDQIAITKEDGPFLQGGDSGSGLLWGQEAVGLCFAGSDTIGIANQFPNVELELGITLARV